MLCSVVLCKECCAVLFLVSEILRISIASLSGFRKGTNWFFEEKVAALLFSVSAFRGTQVAMEGNMEGDIDCGFEMNDQDKMLIEQLRDKYTKHSNMEVIFCILYSCTLCFILT